MTSELKITRSAQDTPFLKVSSRQVAHLHYSIYTDFFLFLFRLETATGDKIYIAFRGLLHCNRYQNNCCHESAFFCPKARKEQRLASTSLHFSTVLGTPKLKTVSEFYCSVHTDHEKTPTQFARPYFAVAKGSNSLAFKLISITTVPYKL